MRLILNANSERDKGAATAHNAFHITRVRRRAHANAKFNNALLNLKRELIWNMMYDARLSEVARSRRGFVAKFQVKRSREVIPPRIRVSCPSEELSEVVRVIHFTSLCRLVSELQP